MRCLSVLAFVLVALPVAAQDGPPAQTPQPLSQQQRKYPQFPPPPKGNITGTVLCADTHHPARGATVLAIPINTANVDDLRGELGAQNVRVGMDGTYLITKVYPGEYTIVAILPGYLSPMDAISIAISDIDTNAKSTGASAAAIREVLLRNGSVTVHGEETETFDLSLQRGAAISGSVLYSDGSPATQVSIAIENTVGQSQKASLDQQIDAVIVRGMFSTQSLFTDDRGRYRIAGIQPGTYRIATIASQKSSFKEDDNSTMTGAMSGMFDPSAIHIYAGDTMHKKTAKTFELRPGDELSGIDITIPIDAFHRVSGFVAAKDGRPINSAGLTLVDDTDDSVSFSAIAGRDGTFQFPAIPAGTYMLTAKRAKMFNLPPNMPDDVVIPDSEISNVFADYSITIIVKNSDLTGVNLTLTEVPPPSDAKSGRTPQPPQ